MNLVFIHGWGFGPGFWDPLAALLPQYQQRRLNLGFFGEATKDVTDNEASILIGHSLGFVHGMKMKKNWSGWIAINSFPRFVATEESAGCIPAAVLLRMQKQLQRDPKKTLADFYHLIGAETPATSAKPCLERLNEGLDELRHSDIREDLAHHKMGLVLAAQNDPLVPMATSESMASSNTTLVVHPTGGHVLPQSAAPWCAEAITNFIAEHFGTR